MCRSLWFGMIIIQNHNPVDPRQNFLHVSISIKVVLDMGANTDLASENSALTTLNQTGDYSQDDYIDQFTVTQGYNGNEGYYHDGYYDEQPMASLQKTASILRFG